MEKIYFVTGNEEKYKELKSIFDISTVELERYPKSIQELQIEEGDELVRDKALQAYKEIRRPLIVEHTALYIRAFEDLPGLHTNYFYSKLGCKGIVEYCIYKNQFEAYVESLFCYCDGKKCIVRRGKEDGYIESNIDESEKGFDWDKIFKPENSEFTYNKLGRQKMDSSMRRKAWEELKEAIKKDYPEEKNEEEAELQNLAELIKQKKVLLFVGAGISASIGLPTWDFLMESLGEKEGFENTLFRSHGDNMMLAEYVNKDIIYEELRKRMCISKDTEEWEKLKQSEIYKLLLELDFPVIYTTNFDTLLENYFDIQNHEYKKIVKISDLEKEEDCEEVTRIVKFHGDIECEESIVLSESQYFERMDFRSFLDILLQADMLKYHILFLGYSLSDINIKLLLYLMRKQLKQNGIDKKAFIFTATPNQVQKKVFEKNGIVTFSGNTADKKKGTTIFLKKLYKKVQQEGNKNDK